MKIKNIKYVAAAMLLGLSVTSCSDFLDRPVEDNYNTENFNTDDTSCIKGVNYLYNSPWYDFQRAFIKIGEVMSGNMYWGSSPYMNFSLNGTDQDLVNMSYSLWAEIGHANTVYNSIKGSGASESVKNQCMGECLAWKAMAYFYLVRTFGDVPIVHDNSTHIGSGDYNDLHKAMLWATSKFKIQNSKFSILGATGKREDHTLGNISYLITFAEEYPGINLEMLTDHGRFCALSSHLSPFIFHLPSFPHQQVSLFTPDPATSITSDGLRWPLRDFHARRAVACADQSAGQIFHAVDAVFGRSEAGLRGSHVRLCEQNGLRALLRVGEAGDAHVDRARGDRADDRVEVHRYDLKLHAELIRDVSGDVGVEAYHVALRVVRFVRRIVRRHAHSQLAFGAQLVFPGFGTG